MNFAETAIFVMSIWVALVTVRVLFDIRRRLKASGSARQAILKERATLARVCPRCGYDVRAAGHRGAALNCPECGEAIVRAETLIKP